MGERTGKTSDCWEVLWKELFQEKNQEAYLQFTFIFITKCYAISVSGAEELIFSDTYDVLVEKGSVL